MALKCRSAVRPLGVLGLGFFLALGGVATAASDNQGSTLAKDADVGMVIDRFKLDDKGETYWLKARVPTSRWVSPRGTLGVVQTIPVVSRKVQIWDLPAGLNSPAHPAPENQFVAVLSGVVKVTLSNGTSKSFRAGDVFLATDGGTGKGHRTETVGGAARVLLVPIEADLDVDAWTVPQS